MSSSNRMKDLRQWIPSLFRLAIVVSASAGLATHSHAQTAKGTGTAKVVVTSWAWFANTPTIEDQGGDYSAPGTPPTFTATAQVQIGALPTTKESYATIAQGFTLVPYTGPTPDLTYDVTLDAVAMNGDITQRATAFATNLYDPVTNKGASDTGATASGAPKTDHNTIITHMTVLGSVATGFTDRLRVRGYAWELEGGAF